MNIPLFNAEKKQEGSVELPVQFAEKVRADLIARAVITQQLNARQPYGTKPEAGTRVSAQVSRRRRQYRGSYGRGISRVPRKVLSRSGRQMFWVGAQAPGTVSGRRAHPPKADKIWEKKINTRELSKAMRSALAATLDSAAVSAHGHKLPQGYPFAVADSITAINKTKQLKDALVNLGFTDELKRTSVKKVRAGRGKSRGRKYDGKVGPLIVVDKNCPLVKSAANIPGVQIVTAEQLTAEMLAPGAIPGRLTLYTKSAIDKIKAERLFE